MQGHIKTRIFVFVCVYAMKEDIMGCVNWFDDIIQERQEIVDDLCNLYDFHQEKWKKRFSGSHSEPHKAKRKKLRFLVVEDCDNKQWFIYDSDDTDIPYMKIPFGDFTIMLLNGLHGKEYYGGLLYDKRYLDSLSDKTISLLNDLATILINLKHYEKTLNQNDLRTTIFRIWSTFRYCTLKPWGYYVELSNSTAEDYSDLAEDEIEEMVSLDREEAKDGLQMLHRIISQHFFVYYDRIIFKDNDKVIWGNAYIAESVEYIFSLDLWHILNGDVPSPRRCPRCKMLYFSNNYKAKYCPDCKQDSKTIRAENRKKNPCRYLHKQITDLLNNYGDGSEDFRKESNYYWAIIQGRAPKAEPINIDPAITTEKAYYDWLTKQKELAKIH